MIAARLAIAGLPKVADPSSTGTCALSSASCSFLHSPVRNLGFRATRSCRSGVFLIFCRSDVWRSSGDGSGGREEERDEEFVEASLLLSETISHYRGLTNGYVEEMKMSWQEVPHKGSTFRLPLKEPQMSISLIGQGILRHFQNPTVFLKISCDGEFLLPIAVGEHAIERLADALWEAKDEDYPNQFQFIKNLVLRLGYEVDLVRITKRVNNGYFAKVCLSKPGETDSINIDIRPGDAINIARRCMAPIYVSKWMFNTDAFQIAYGMMKMHSTKSVYDVTLDSPADGPDMLFRELDLIKNMKLAVLEERYNDAAIINDLLMDLRKT